MRPSRLDAARTTRPAAANRAGPRRRAVSMLGGQRQPDHLRVASAALAVRAIAAPASQAVSALIRSARTVVSRVRGVAVNGRGIVDRGLGMRAPAAAAAGNAPEWLPRCLCWACARGRDAQSCALDGLCCGWRRADAAAGQARWFDASPDPRAPRGPPTCRVVSGCRPGDRSAGCKPAGRIGAATHLRGATSGPNSTVRDRATAAVSALSRRRLEETAFRRLWWRRERDSNPRYRFRYTHFPGVRLQPLGHPSVREPGARARTRRAGRGQGRAVPCC